MSRNNDNIIGNVGISKHGEQNEKHQHSDTQSVNTTSDLYQLFWNNNDFSLLIN